MMFEYSFSQWCAAHGRHPQAHTSRVEWNALSRQRYDEIKDIPIRSEFRDGPEGDADYNLAKAPPQHHLGNLQAETKANRR